MQCGNPGPWHLEQRRPGVTHTGKESGAAQSGQDGVEAAGAGRQPLTSSAVRFCPWGALVA